jgi:hypothetical protein
MNRKKEKLPPPRTTEIWNASEYGNIRADHASRRILSVASMREALPVTAVA